MLLEIIGAIHTSRDLTKLNLHCHRIIFVKKKYYHEFLIIKLNK